MSNNNNNNNNNNGSSNTYFPTEDLLKINGLRIGIHGKGISADVTIANLASLGVGTIYFCNEGNYLKKNLLPYFNESGVNRHMITEDFLSEKFPNLVFFEESDKDLSEKKMSLKDAKEEYCLDYIIQLPSTNDPLRDGIEGILAVDTIRKDAHSFAKGEYRHCLEKPSKKHSYETPIGDYSLFKKRNTKVPLEILCVGGGGIGNYFALASSILPTAVRMYDDDFFEQSNLNRQIFARIGENKAATLEAYFPNIRGINQKITKEFIERSLSKQKKPDIIVGCVDNTHTRNLLIQFGKEQQIPFFDGGVDVSTGRIDLNPKEFSLSKEELLDSEKKTSLIKKKKTHSCALVKNPSVVVPNAIIGFQLARCLANKERYTFDFNTLYQNRISEIQ